MKPLRNQFGSVKPYTRHEKACKHYSEPNYNDCRCPKWLYEHPQNGPSKRRSLKTPSWAEALEIASATLRTFDPEIREARADKAREQLTIEEAVALYLADVVTRLGDGGTAAMARSLFGAVDRETHAVERKGRLFEWLYCLPSGERPVNITEITPAHLTAWRGSWKFKSDMTAAQRWTMVKSFFNFCESQGWIDDSPARKLKSLSVSKGGRTAIFTDEQYVDIVDAIALSAPENVPELTRKSWQQRLHVFVELLRWSGMALVDAVQYRPELVDSEGVLRYRRHKTGELATVPFPDHVVVLLRGIPLERDSVGSQMPFRTKQISLLSDTAKWHRRVTALFTLAGIKTVKTEQGKSRPPHPHMLRDTFAVWHLRHGAHLRTVSKMLGHAKTTTTEKAYLPWVKELEEAHIADARKSLAKLPKATGKVLKFATAKAGN